MSNTDIDLALDNLRMDFMPTFCQEGLHDFLLNYLGLNVVSFLIYYPELGLGDYTTEIEYERRRLLTMAEAVTREIDISGGYRRCLYGQLDTYLRPDYGVITLKGRWQALGGTIGPFTHVCVARAANTYAASPINGNNRGDYTGTLLLVQPVGAMTSAGMTLTPPFEYEATLPLRVVSRIP